MKKIIFFLVISIPVVFVSCSKDEATDEVLKNKYVQSRIVVDKFNQVISEYHYDYTAYNLLISMDLYKSNDDHVKRSFMYDNDHLSEMKEYVNDELVYTHTYEYSEFYSVAEKKQIQHNLAEVPVIQYVEQTLFDEGNNSIITERDAYIGNSENSKNEFRKVCKYEDGNLIKVTYYTQKGTEEILAFEMYDYKYDDHPNAYYMNNNNLEVSDLSRNNALSYKLKIHSTGQVYEYKNKISYNDEDYPVEIKRFIDGDEISTVKYSYIENCGCSY